MNEKVIEHNLELMTSEEQGGLTEGVKYALNRGPRFYGRMPYVCVNIIFELDTCRILQFVDAAFVASSRGIGRGEGGATLDILLEKVYPNARARILSVLTCYTDCQQQVLKETMRRYNAQYGFEIPPDVPLPQFLKPL